METQERRPSDQEGIEVIIRIKPRTQQSTDEDNRRCVFLSPTEVNTIVVETQNKKEFFSFDHIASENSQQQEIYDSIGQPVLEQSFKGFNCCIFAYGQTGAGKTFSILGNANELTDDSYCQSRGILPRLLEQLFILLRRASFKSFSVRCSYLEIYNEQIIDLLNKDIKTYQIREDHRKGVYVEGLSEQSIHSYEESLDIILKGLKNRKMAATSMNSESSRSHAIFTLCLTIDLEEDGLQKTRYSKIHIVDLAGSERTKLAKVEGQRLREGCNINKSLHTLGNVINSLVESAKKKKYIPFRDSKLTFFLKDSLGGNSKTKLLANIHPCRAYLGDTISTLMFAKRAKILKVRVQANENIADNFESLRNEIRKLREQLAQTKFIKNEPKSSDLDETQRERFVDISITDLDQTQQKVLKVFQDNQMHYRSLLQVYQQRLASVTIPSIRLTQDYSLKSMFQEKRQLQKTCGNYAQLLNNFPSFTKIFKENLELKKKIKTEETSTATLTLKNTEMQIEMEALKNNNRFLKSQLEEVTIENASLRQQIEQLTHTASQSHNKYSVIHGRKDHPSSPTSSESLPITLSPLRLEMKYHQVNSHDKGAITRRDQMKEILHRQNEMLESYEKAIEQLKLHYNSYIRQLSESYQQLEKDIQIQKDYKQSLRRQQKRKQLPPQLETLENENEYLKLNVMELETELNRVEDECFKKQIQLKTLQEESHKLRQDLEKMEKASEQYGLKEQELVQLLQKVKEISVTALEQQKEIEEERDRIQNDFKQVKQTLIMKMKENYELASKYESLATNNTNLKKKLSEIIKLESQQSVIMGKQSACWTTLEEDALSEDFQLERTINNDLAKEIDKLVFEKEQLLNKLEEEQQKGIEERTKLQKASNKILSLTRELTKTKQDNKHEAQELRRLQLRVEEFEHNQRKQHEKTKLLQCQYHRFKKEMNQLETLNSRTKEDVGKELPEIVEEYKTLKTRNNILCQQNQRLRTANNETRGLQGINTKSMRYLPVVKQNDYITPRNQVKLDQYRSVGATTAVNVTTGKKQEPRRRESFGQIGQPIMKKPDLKVSTTITSPLNFSSRPVTTGGNSRQPHNTKK